MVFILRLDWHGRGEGESESGGDGKSDLMSAD